ncbi:MAG: hypothetical protein JWO40_114 [Candidatus Doudnabacteria bacterium]|nr:hypothetical protein [Candidatus Doudnabacteria bacterium]
MQVNFLAVLVASIVSIIIGSIWYGPLFGKMFIELSGMNQWSPEKQAEMKKTMNLSYLGQFVASLVTFYVLALFINRIGQVSIMGGIVTALWIWLGFLVTQKFGETLWGGKMTLFWLNAGSSLLIYVAGGAIIGAWR